MYRTMCITRLKKSQTILHISQCLNKIEHIQTNNLKLAKKMLTISTELPINLYLQKQVSVLSRLWNKSDDWNHCNQFQSVNAEAEFCESDWKKLRIRCRNKNMF